ncbi:glycine zipper family protein [Methylobacter sp. S3L5C]|uniref:glycine zipper family protein n=1 Tax=Methylobacter sp. S3L5C TaxID=2839024 RepID=UPI001FACB8E7|nr:glycine zipper family protein [Methylobacter sp. S3L5C]UOA09050.1 hypothetical protein KKZ03_01635 [Methylobacter sp. S3L5C]
MNKPYGKKFLIAAISLCYTVLLPVAVQGDIVVYPAKGQSSDQLTKDRYECHLWAVKQSGFDPANVQAPQSKQKGEVIRGGARGAAAGAAIGAIAGAAGKGAAIGATAGGLKRGFQKLDSKKAEQSQVVASSSAQDFYNRALGACLSGRGYSVN